MVNGPNGLNHENRIQKLVELLRANHILAGLTDDQIGQLAAKAHFERHKLGSILNKEGSQSQKFYFIIEGQVKLFKGQERATGYLYEGQFGGESTYLATEEQLVTERVAVDVVLAVFDQAAFDWLTSIEPAIASRLKAQETLRESDQIMVFDGQQDNEVVAIKEGRHVVAFLAKLPGPLLLVTLGIGISVLLLTTTALSNYFHFLPGCLIVLGLLLLLYIYLDWRNDEFIVSSDRAVHIERILLHGETRHEAPLTAIQDVSVIVPGILAKFFDYSDLHIKTAGAGTMIFDGIKDAEIMRDEVFKQRQKAKERAEASDLNTVRTLIRESMGLGAAATEDDDSIEPGDLESKGFQLKLPVLSYYIPRVQEVDGDTIIWRKNYFVYLRLVLAPLLTFLVVFYLTAAAFIGFFPFGGGSTTLGYLLLLTWPFILLWYTYRYDVWRKDEYMVNHNEIVDYQGSGFNLAGEQRRVGTFDVIQNTTFYIPNFLSKLLNIGHVVIETAGTEMTFTFKWVYNPSGVQKEIFERWLAHKAAKLEEDRSYEEQRIARWMGEFYGLLQTDEQAAGAAKGAG